MYIMGDQMYWRFCAKVVNHVRKSTVLEHIGSAAHRSRKEQEKKQAAEAQSQSNRPISADDGDITDDNNRPTSTAAINKTKLQMDMSTSFRAATEQQSVKAEINHNLITALLVADIPFEKMDNPAMREFFRKHVKNGGAIGTATYMRYKLSEVLDQHKARLANSLAQYKTFSIVADETTDAVDRCVLNTLLIPDLSGNLSGSGHISLKPLLLDVTVLEATNSATLVLK